MVLKLRDKIELLDLQTFAYRNIASKYIIMLRHAIVLVSREAEGSLEVHATATTDRIGCSRMAVGLAQHVR